MVQSLNKQIKKIKKKNNQLRPAHSSNTTSTWSNLSGLFEVQIRFRFDWTFNEEPSSALGCPIHVPPSSI